MGRLSHIVWLPIASQRKVSAALLLTYIYSRIMQSQRQIVYLFIFIIIIIISMCTRVCFCVPVARPPTEMAIVRYE